jgi:phosphoribosyl-ATP pyrophosphohydrolase/phosphoribosyl-AMP cyclohydrolase/histidinol dehydrogenase
MTDSLRRISPEQARRLCRPPVDRPTLLAAGEIVDRVRTEGLAAIRACAEKFGERGPSDPLVLGRRAMREALDALEPHDRASLERAADRIGAFAAAQRDAVRPVTLEIPGGQAGHTIEPVRAAGCYAPGGRYPLPSTVLMTAVTARTAGCERVVVASPGANPVTLAAAAVAGADEFLALGGAHAIAAMAFGFEGPAPDRLDPVDVIAGPGNRWVTAAKQLVSGSVGIDMLAGPSELLVLADDTADTSLVAADLLAQAEHDADAAPLLVTTCPALADTVQGEIARQLRRLPTQETARLALRNGFVCLARDIDEAIALTDRLAPEHLEVMTADAPSVASRVRNAGAVFIGPRSAEVLGDYGAGPNHTLPTGGTARFQGGLSVIHFLRLRTWIRLDHLAPARALLEDTARLADLEGLAAHAASARARLG